jgi:hypothetical protein
MDIAKPMNPETDKLVLRSLLRVRAQQAFVDYKHTARNERERDIALAHRQEFVDIVHNALIEAAMKGVESAIHGLYDLAGIPKEEPK